MPKILRNKLFRNWFGHPVQSLRSLCSRCFAVQNFKILNSCQNKWMHELLYQNEWVAIFYHYCEVYHANVCKIQNSSFMHKCVFLLRPHKWLDFNDALIFFFFCSAYCIWMEWISSTVSIICSMSILGNATYSELSRRTEITPLEHIAQKEQNWRQLQSRIFLHQMRIEQCIYSRMRSL